MSENDQSLIFDATQEGVAFIRLNRPEVHNALNADMAFRMIDLLDQVRGSDGIRLVFVEGVGKSFSAGADLDHMRQAGSLTRADNLADAERLADMFYALRALPMPTVALVHGAAVGGGAGLAAACDICIADKSAIFGFSEVRLGLIPSTISPYVIEAIGSRNARRYFTTGERFGAEEAQRLGLVHIVVEDKNALQNEAERIANEVLKNGPKAVAASLDLVEDVMLRVIDGHLRHETAKRIADIRATDEALEGTAAFLEKRKPNWMS